MGCDGGTIPTRGELVKEKKRDVKLDPKIGLDAKVSLDPRTLSLAAVKLTRFTATVEDVQAVVSATQGTCRCV